MKELLWRLVARIVTIQRVRRWIISRAMRTPYRHIMRADGGETYMHRWWLFNPYRLSDCGRRWSWLPSVRVHHICRGDQARHMHSHPWDARTIIMDGWYFEQTRPSGKGKVSRYREQGYTGRLRPGDYHRINCVPIGGVWTLFFTWCTVEDWGFLVNGTHVPHADYLRDRV